MVKCTNVRMCKCTTIQMFRCINVQTRTNVKIHTVHDISNPKNKPNIPSKEQSDRKTY